MSETKFTPGPWEHNCNYVSAYGRGTICTAPMPKDGGVFDVQENLDLIAALPDLYAALEEAQRLLSLCEFSEPSDLDGVALVESALAKARGEEPKP